MKDIPGRGNSSCKDVEVGMHVICARSSEKASMHTAEGARERAVLCDTGKTSKNQTRKAREAMVRILNFVLRGTGCASN